MEHTSPATGAIAHPQAEPPRPSTGAGWVRLRRSTKWVIPLAVLVVAGGTLAWQHPATETGLTGTVERGDLTVRLTETGVLRPAQSLTYRSPLAGRQTELLYLAPEGTRVQTGDLVVRLDGTELDNELGRAHQTLRQARVQLRVATAEHEEAMADVESMADGEGALSVREARFNLELTEKRVAQLRQEYEGLVPLLERGFITREELDRAGFELDKAEGELTLDRLRTNLFLERTFPRDTQRAQLRLAQQEAQLEDARTRVDEAGTLVAALQEAIEACSMYARRPGLVIYEEYLSSNPRRKIRVGDRVTSTQGLVTIPEVDRMLVESSVRETDLHRVRVGQRSTIRLDAFPDLQLTGQVLSLGALAHASATRPYEEKRFDLVVEVDASVAELRPEMTARLDLLVAERHDVLLVPVNAIFEREDHLVANVITGWSSEHRQVELGATGDLFAEVVSGLDEGDHVALLDTPPAGNAPQATRSDPAPARASIR
jgi:HlyD family secretion protein